MFKKLLLLLGIVSVSGVLAGDFGIRNFKIDHANGFYKRGEDVVVSGVLLKAGKPAPEYKLRAITKWESVKVVATQEFPCDGKPFRVIFKSDKPGWVYFIFQVIGPDGKVVIAPAAQLVQGGKKELVAEIGVMIGADEIRPADECPADFDEFWKNERAKLNAVPINPRL